MGDYEKLQGNVTMQAFRHSTWDFHFASRTVRGPTKQQGHPQGARYKQNPDVLRGNACIQIIFLETGTPILWHCMACIEVCLAQSVNG